MESSNQGWPPRSPMELIKYLGILDTLSHKWPQPHELQGHPRDPRGTYIRLIDWRFSCRNCYLRERGKPSASRSMRDVALRGKSTRRPCSTCAGVCILTVTPIKHTTQAVLPHVRAPVRPPRHSATLSSALGVAWVTSADPNHPIAPDIRHCPVSPPVPSRLPSKQSALERHTSGALFFPFGLPGKPCCWFLAPLALGLAFLTQGEAHTGDTSLGPRRMYASTCGST